MFVVILAQSAATSRAFATRYDESFSENTDLVGLALANIGAGLSGTFVVNGSPTKTQIVDDAGGRSQLSLLVMAAMVALILLFLCTGALTFLPEAALSAIVFLIGVGLIDVAGMRRVFDQRRTEFWLALITALTVVIVGAEQGYCLPSRYRSSVTRGTGINLRTPCFGPTPLAVGSPCRWPSPLRRHRGW